MGIVTERKIFEYIRNIYAPQDYPALADELDKWRRSRPFAGTKLLDATPVFTNTLVKYMPLLAGGATLSVGIGELTPYDPKLLPLLREWGLRVLAPAECSDGEFDIVMDCAGMFSGLRSRCGYVELTRSGLYSYRGVNAPVFFADAGKIKLIETTLGTGDGYCRALEHLGYDLGGKRLLVFGGGKVGRGIAMHSNRAGARVCIADFEPRKLPKIEGVGVLDAGNEPEVAAAIRKADFVVSATGVEGALTGHAKVLLESSAVIANMGVLDEFGADLPAERVLNAKRPLNFILDEPTRLKYIDPTMALDNAGALEVLTGRVERGVADPPAELEKEILDTVRRSGAIGEELNWIGDENHEVDFH